MTKLSKSIQTYETDKWKAVEMLASQVKTEIDERNCTYKDVHCKRCPLKYNIPNSVYQLLGAIEGATQGGTKDDWVHEAEQEIYQRRDLNAK